MSFKAAALAICVTLLMGGSARAADLAERPRALVRTQAVVCPVPGTSIIATRPSVTEMQAEVSARYVDAGMNSEIPPTVFNRSPRFIWASAARNACGIALGYLSTGEVNIERLWNCECYHARMSSFPLARVR